MRTPFLSLIAVTFNALLVPSAIAQTYFYIGTISVDPAAPTTNDGITISLDGQLSSTGASVVSTSFSVVDGIVYITVNAADPGGATVLVPHTEEIFIGSLPAGSYGILVNGDFILDSAPEFQHGFNVSEVWGGTCDDLTIASVQWAAFSDEVIIIHVLNEGDGFSYPTFVLLNAVGDTIARETPNVIGMGPESWHSLSLNPDVEVPVGEFAATLHLWTNFFSEQACSWEMTVDLCPASECVTVFPYIGNFGGAIVNGSFAWSINDDAGAVANGTFVLTDEQQSAQAEVCLTPASHTLVVTPLQEPAGGQLVIGVGGEAWSDAVQQPFPQVIPSEPLEFDVVPRCFDTGNAITPNERNSDLLEVRSVPGGVEVRTGNGSPLGQVELLDVLGRMIHVTSTSTDRLRIGTPASGPYLLRARGTAVKFLTAEL